MRHHIQKRMLGHFFLLLLLWPATFLSALSTTVRHAPAGVSVRATDSPDTPVLIQHQPPPTPDGTLLVSTLDGTLHALDLRSGEYLWSFGAGASLLHSSFEKEARKVIEKRRAAEAEMDLMAEAEWNTEHQRETSQHASASLSQALSRHEQFERDLNRDLASHDLLFDQDEEEHSAHKRLEQQRKVDAPRASTSNNGSTSPLMIPGVDGSLFYSGTHGLQRLPINVAELVEAAPFKTGDNTRYLGFKETNVFLIHRNSGALKRVFSPMHNHKFSLFEECEDAECDPNLIWVAKTDLTVHAIDGKSGKLRWNVSISTYAPFDNTESVLEMTESDLSDLGYPEIGVSVGGTVHAIDISEQHILWSQPLHSPVTSVFLVRPEQPTGASSQDNVHVLNNAGDMIKLPHFYFDVPDDGTVPTADKVDPLHAMIDHYHRSRDLSEVTTFTYIGQTKNGLIYALPNPQPIQSAAKLFVDQPVHPMSSLAMSAVPAVAKPMAGSPTISSITVSSHATVANTKAIAGSDPISADDIDEELHCSPSSPTYPQCLIGFHAMNIGSGNAAANSARNQQLLFESSVDFFNRSVKPANVPAIDHPTTTHTSTKGGESGDGKRKPHSGALPAPVKNPYESLDEEDESLVSRTNPMHTPSVHPKPKPKKDTDYAPSFPGAHPSESFWTMWWQMLLMSVVISVLISLFMMWLQRQERKRKRALQAKKSALKKKGSESDLLAPGESSQDGIELSDDDGDGNFTMSRFSREFGNVGREFSSTASNFGRGIVGQTAAMRKRFKKELLRGVFQRQTSEPTPPPSAPSPHSPNNATASGTLTTRKSHFSTYESDVPLFPNSGNNSGESKSLRPRKHIQSKPEINKMNEDAASSSLAPTLNKVFSTTTQHPDGSVSIGSMVLFPQKVLGTGSMGTVVYAGTFEGRPCAIKRLVKPFFGSANAAQEIALLIQSDQHPNVLRYYAKDEDTSFIYLALEQCVGTIQDLVDNPKTEYSDDQLKSILFGMMTGLAHLHSLHIVHRDIKPGNILLSSSKSTLTAKLADMGLGKQLSLSRSSFDSVVSGSIGWQAPECLASGGRLTKAVDVFSAGIVMHYVLTKGVHPFGENVERELNIAHNRMDLSALAPYPEARDLIGCMLHYDPAMRMSAEDVVAHPYFWSPAKQLSFLLEASDRFESEPEHSELRMCLESQALEVVGENWHQHLHSGLVDNLHKYRKYDFSSVRDCLRVIRNKKNHYRDLPAELRAELGPIPEGFLNYFASKFPAMLIYIYSVLSCFCLESPSSGFGDMYSYSPLDQDHFSYDADMRLEAVQAFFYKPLRDYPELRFSSPQFEQFYSLISLRRLVQLQKHTRLRFRHWHVHEDRWLKAGIPPVAANAASASNTASSSPLTEANTSNIEPPPLLVSLTNENKED